ncbi:DNA-binding transcriptional ArsR family regulator [Agrobacterium pusense]|nr:DNA-binding transcriptional ArsR family regulator [Rhizobium sp. SORGH_AS_0755]MDR6189610.1 DNA-binding transcriptional ArsR family regulator [Agrobacterium pusense]
METREGIKRSFRFGGSTKNRYRRDNGLAKHISACLCVFMTENDIFRALADPTRRAIFEKLADGAMNASALREGIEISQPAMSQHLSVLRGAGLVVERRQGRFVNYEVDPEGLTRIAAWLGKYRAYWPQRIEALKLLLKDMDQ